MVTRFLNDSFHDLNLLESGSFGMKLLPFLKGPAVVEIPAFTRSNEESTLAHLWEIEGETLDKTSRK